MEIKNMIYKLRTEAKMSQEDFAAKFNVSRQSVQKWESGMAVPELSKIIEISKYFDISLDALILKQKKRVVEEMKYNKIIKPKYSDFGFCGLYADILTEYLQSIEEGLDIETYKGLFEIVARLPMDEIKKKLGDVLFEIVINAKIRSDYQYSEPSELEKIKALRKKENRNFDKRLSEEELENRVHGAWLGRICGCMLGKTVEGISTEELIPLLKETNNYPMHRYIYKSDINENICKKYSYPLKNRAYIDEINGMPVDDDTNYILLSQLIVDKYGMGFTPYDVSRAWLEYQSRDCYCTAERVAYCNFINGYEPPQSAMYKNPYREWIGAQIRGDYYGYINPGDPEKAAEMAWRDASISHVKNGIYGEMFVAAMLAAAAVNEEIRDIILIGLGEIPHTSRYYEEIMGIVKDFDDGVAQRDCFEKIHKKYDEHTGHGWCHTISNAMIVVAALLYGKGDYGKSVCMAVEAGFDTDCNGATVGSVLGMRNGLKSIPECWTKPINDTLYTSIFGYNCIKISDGVKKTIEHIKLNS